MDSAATEAQLARLQGSDEDAAAADEASEDAAAAAAPVSTDGASAAAAAPADPAAGSAGSAAAMPAAAAALVNQVVRAELADGRVVYGRLSCLDRDCNLVLSTSQEYGPAADKPDLELKRNLGQVIIAGKDIVTFAVAQPPAK